MEEKDKPSNKQLEFLQKIGMSKFDSVQYLEFFLGEMQIGRVSYFIELAQNTRKVIPYAEFQKNEKIFNNPDKYIKAHYSQEEQVKQRNLRHFDKMLLDAIKSNNKDDMQILAITYMNEFGMTEEELKEHIKTLGGSNE